MSKKEFKNAADIFLNLPPKKREGKESKHKHLGQSNEEELITISKPQKRKTRTRKFTVLMPQELFVALKEKSKGQGISMNEITNQLLEAYVRQS